MCVCVVCPLTSEDVCLQESLPTLECGFFFAIVFQKEKPLQSLNSVNGEYEFWLQGGPEEAQPALGPTAGSPPPFLWPPGPSTLPFRVSL